MSVNNFNKLEFLYLKIHDIDYQALLDIVSASIKHNKRVLITGANVHTTILNLQDNEFNNAIKKFDIIHPDGIGLYLASKFLYGKNGLKKRINGSDFYEYLIPIAIKNKLSFFFFGDEQSTLNLIHVHLPNLIIKGVQNGFVYDNESLIERINNSGTEILIIGLGSGKQEKWIADNCTKIKTPIVLAVGDGIKIFAGNKKRGPKFFRKLGLEWFIRFLSEPKRLWKRYFIGIPLFIFRVIRYKFSSEFKG